MKDPIKLSMRRGATTLLNAMQNGSHGRFAMVESISGEKPHAIILAATEENPTLLRSLVRLLKKHTAPSGGRP